MSNLITIAAALYVYMDRHASLGITVNNVYGGTVFLWPNTAAEDRPFRGVCAHVADDGAITVEIVESDCSVVTDRHISGAYDTEADFVDCQRYNGWRAICDDVIQFTTLPEAATLPKLGYLGTVERDGCGRVLPRGSLMAFAKKSMLANKATK
jgi:hypothetical protein